MTKQDREHGRKPSSEEQREQMADPEVYMHRYSGGSIRFISSLTTCAMSLLENIQIYSTEKLAELL